MTARALKDAQPDGLVMPFVENYRYLKPLLLCQERGGLLGQILELGEAYEGRCALLRADGARPAALAVLTEREQAIAQLIARRMSNREIGEKLFLSEGSVKQYVNQIYSKLMIGGDTRTKRRQLQQLMEEKT